MKIALVSTMNLPVPAVRGGAVEELTTHIINENEKQKKFEIDLYTIYDSKIDINQYKHTNIIQIKSYFYETIIRKTINLKNKIFKTGKKYNFLYRKLARKVIKQHYDKIIVENNMEVYIEIQKLTKDPIIYHMHNDFNSSDKTLKNYEIVSNTAEKIITVSYYIKDRLESISDNKNIFVLLNAIDDKLYDDNISHDLRKKYNFDKKDIIIGYSGRITEEKGVLELIKSIKKINTKKSIKLLIVGSQWYGNLKNDLYMKKIREEVSPLKDKIFFTGYVNQNDMPNIYKTIDILAIPSMCEEAFGCISIEGMAMGNPIVASESGELSRIIKKDFGYIVKKNDAFIDNFAVCLEKLINNDSLRKKYSLSAKKEFDNNLNYHKKQYYINFYNIIKNDGE